ncbi:PREDICTED: uncharacterized protein LOC104738362 [Camelina sativa]|uniref:Uncharacterized protein LOC104738362 n=1 Tax=Camelina sativa TaxID=90675 RepID=A0ABM1QTP5_CAMSA|nr:PREDICTED: uncharacterized protein LOC104738362 [Camelina sativa]
MIPWTYLDISYEAYRREKMEGKKTSLQGRREVWNRLEQGRATPYRSPSPQKDPPLHPARDMSTKQRGRQLNHEATPVHSRRGKNMPRSRSSKQRTEVRDCALLSERGRRKQRYEDTFGLEPRRVEEERKDQALDSRLDYSNSRKAIISSKPTPCPLDSQATISDLQVATFRAKEIILSPDHVRERPFRLNLQKKAGPQTPSFGKDTLVAIPPNLVVKINKNWYDQTVEEEEAALQETPLEDRFNNSIRIADPRPIIVSPRIMREPQTKNYVPSLDLAETKAVDTDEYLQDVDRDALEWDENYDDLDKVDLEWTEEDAKAYREAVASGWDPTGIDLDADDLLGEERQKLDISAGAGVYHGG